MESINPGKRTLPPQRTRRTLPSSEQSWTDNIESRIPRDLLSLLRSVESTPPGDLDWALHCTRQQAMIMSLQFAGGRPASLEQLAEAFAIPIQVREDIPIDATAFPTKDGGWTIHISASLTPSERMRQVVHHLKHIIDHPIRHHAGSEGFTAADYEHLAHAFTNMVLGAAPDHSPAE